MKTLAVAYSDLEEASKRLAGKADRTPVLVNADFDQVVRAEVFFKCENLQRAGAFKFRGAFNAISSLSDAEKKRGVLAYSSGNHAQAIALAGQILDVKTTIIMPSDAPKIKVENTRRYGAKIVFYDRKTEDRETLAASYMTKHGLTLIPPYDHPAVIAGQGTAAKELFEEVPDLDYLFVCVGGGGLLAGSAIAAKHFAPDCTLYGVEPEAGNDVQQSMAAGKMIKIPVPETIADGAQTQQVGKLPFAILQALVKEILTVSDEQLRLQMKFFAEKMKLIVEPTGCLSAAAVYSNTIDLKGAKVGVIISGGNVDMDRFCQLINTAV